MQGRHPTHEDHMVKCCLRSHEQQLYEAREEIFGKESDIYLDDVPSLERLTSDLLKNTRQEIPASFHADHISTSVLAAELERP